MGRETLLPCRQTHDKRQGDHAMRVGASASPTMNRYPLCVGSWPNLGLIVGSDVSRRTGWGQRCAHDSEGLAFGPSLRAARVGQRPSQSTT